MRKFLAVLFLSLLLPAFSYGQGKDGEYSVLVFGHSYGVDCTEHLPALAAEAGIDNFRIARFVKGNCSMEEHYTFFVEDYDKGYFECEPGNTVWNKYKKTVKEALVEREWDAIVFQNSLENEGFYDKAQPWLDKMVKHILKVQKKKFKNTPMLCWNMFWPISVILEGSVSEPHRTRMAPYDRSSQKMFDCYVLAAKEISEKTLVKNVIPAGTAIMNLRTSELNIPQMKEFTRDGYHLSKGAGRYAAACTWFEYLLQPVYGISVLGNSLRLPDYGSPVVDENARLLQEAAVKAVKRPW